MIFDVLYFGADVLSVWRSYAGIVTDKQEGQMCRKKVRQIPYIIL